MSNFIKQQSRLFYLIYFSFIYLICIPPLYANSHADMINFDIVYVRYPLEGAKGKSVTIPQGEQPYPIAPGADLMLLKANGEERVLVDCNECSVMDPYISLDGKSVYYSLIEKPKRRSASWIYKIDLTKQPYKPIQLTYPDRSDSHLYAANTTEQHFLEDKREIRDMAPVPLSDGRILFTSNRSAIVSLNPGTNGVIRGSVQQLYVMDDHNGDKKTDKQANIYRLEAGNLQTVQHPMQLMNGEILFSSWQGVATKFKYAMTSLFTINPDGTNLKQFSEPHDHNKFLEHFITQLPNEDIIAGYYYPSFDFGYGVLLKYPFDPEGPNFVRGNTVQRSPSGKIIYKSNREFDRKGMLNITPHTSPKDAPAPNRSGKYSMPSVAPNGHLLVSYSKGYVNTFGAACKKKNQPSKCEGLKAGIYLIPNAKNNIITNPSQLIKIKDSPLYNEIWPRAVVNYKSLYGIESPAIKTDSMMSTTDSRIKESEASAIVGTSSVYNREYLEDKNPDPFQARGGKREYHDGNWTIQGAEAGVFSNSDIHAIRIISTPPKPFTKPISKYSKDNKKEWKRITKYLADKRLDRVVARYGSYHGERWEILGEFPLNYKAVQDDQGNPDTSWAAKIPADTPFLIQSLDKNGMTLISELTWRALKPGEVRTDCGGCHAHSIEPLNYETTFSGMRVPITNVSGTNTTSPGLNEGLWDLTTGEIPLLKENGVQYVNKNVIGIEFRRDIEPVLKSRCGKCHTQTGTAKKLILDGSDGKDVWDNISKRQRPDGKKYRAPQRSKYIRIPQARQSLLVWVAYGQRLDGRTNSTRVGDVDYPSKHPTFDINEDEKRNIARWVDLGGPINFPKTDGMGYTDDNQLPIINLKVNNDELSGVSFNVGVYDVHSEIDWNSLKVEVQPTQSKMDEGLTSDNKENNFLIKPNNIDLKSKVATYTLPRYHLKNTNSILITAEIKDTVGNKNIASKYIKIKN